MSRSPRRRSPRTPRLAEALLRLRVPAVDRECVVGDLAEEYRRVRLPLLGRHAAYRWYWGQVLRSLLVVNPSPDSGTALMRSLPQDLRYGVRSLLKAPQFALLTILTLALAIGVNMAIFSMLNPILLRPLPIADPDSMGFFYSTNADRGVLTAPVSAADYMDIRDQITSFASTTAVNRGASFILTGGDEPVQISGFEALANIFELWGVPIVLGRGFAQGEDKPGAARVAVLAYHTWQNRFEGDDSVLGRTIRLDGYETAIIGVVTEELEFGSLATAEVWVPLTLERAAVRRDVRNLWISGRLKPGVSAEQADQEVAAIGRRLAEEYPDTNAGWLPTVVDMNGALAPPQTWALLLLLLSLTVGLVMLIACSNVATMMLARASARGREIAVRAALGARRSRILSQLVTESALLSLASAVVGLGLAKVFLMGLVWMAGANSGISNFLKIVTIDGNVLAFTVLVAGLAPILFGLLPAMRASRPDVVEALKEGGRGNSGAGLRGRRTLVGAQVALALSLMIVAGLAIRGMIETRILDPGFSTAGLLTLRLDLPAAQYPDESDWRAYFDDALARVRQVPQVRQAALVSERIYQSFPPNLNFQVEGRPIPEATEMPWALVSVASDGGLETIGLPLLEGRSLTLDDNVDGISVAMINADAAERFWPDDSALGQRIRLGVDDGVDGGVEEADRWLEIVGIFGNINSGDPENPWFPMMLLPYQQNVRRGMAMLIETDGDPLAAAGSVRQAIWEIDRDQPISDMRTMSQIVDDALAAGETLLMIFVVFAVFAGVMAAAGIYGVISYAVSQRTQEIGIRMALGARGIEVARLIGRQAVVLIVFGMLAGLLGGFGLSRILANAFNGVSTTDPLVLSTVIAVLAVTALLATWIPARRAIRIDPVIALRMD